MNNLYNELSKLNESDGFSAKIPVNITGVPDISVSASDINTNYDITITKTSNGLGYIYPIFKESTTYIEIEEDNGDYREIELNIDLNKLQLDWESASGYYPISIDLEVNDEFKIDYEKSMFSFGYYNPEV